MDQEDFLEFRIYSITIDDNKFFLARCENSFAFAKTEKTALKKLKSKIAKKYGIKQDEIDLMESISKKQVVVRQQQPPISAHSQSPLPTSPPLPLLPQQQESTQQQQEQAQQEQADIFMRDKVRFIVDIDNEIATAAYLDLLSKFMLSGYSPQHFNSLIFSYGLDKICRVYLDINKDGLSGKSDK